MSVLVSFPRLPASVLSILELWRHAAFALTSIEWHMAMQDVRFAVSAFAKETGSSYASYVMQTPPDWLEGIEKGVVRQVCPSSLLAMDSELSRRALPLSFQG